MPWTLSKTSAAFASIRSRFLVGRNGKRVIVVSKRRMKLSHTPAGCPCQDACARSSSLKAHAGYGQGVTQDAAREEDMGASHISDAHGPFISSFTS